MESYNIVLGSKKNKYSVNTDNFIDVELNETSKELNASFINSTFDQYNEYVKEKNASDKYRLIFTIKPYCTNVLFNMFTEITYKEGSDGCIYFGDEHSSAEVPESIREYLGYTKRDETYLNRRDMIRDTAYSHPEIGHTSYHCGYDIFNNHILRQKNFFIFSKMSNRISRNDRVYFNTLEDYDRDINGNMDEEYAYQQHRKEEGGIWSIVRGLKHVHKYQIDDVYTFKECIRERLTEENGWVGFMNRMNVPTVNYSNTKHHTAINKVINNLKACEMVDMYPDRTLFSFLPKNNPYRNRYEYNWDYCITYPWRNNDESPLVRMEDDNGVVVNGLPCYIYGYDAYEEGGEQHLYEDGYITFGTYVRHNLKVGDYVKISLSTINHSTAEPKVKCIKIDTPIKVENVEDADSKYLFRVKASLINAYLPCTDVMGHPEIVDIRMTKMKNGIECKYYFRMFRKLPNFKNTDVYADGEVSEEEIMRYKNTDFSNSLNKLGFSNTIYGDQVAQIVYDDDIITTGIRDNYGRRISELYMTIIKRNKGWKEWYDESDYGNKEIEFSHCFGKVTEGLELSDEMIDYNIHYLHNVDVKKLEGEQKELIIGDVKSLTDERKTNGVTKDDDEFYGDLVEFSPSEYKETVLEDVLHRFNTAQREYTGDKFKKLTYDEIDSDDMDMRDGFKVNEYEITTNSIDGEPEYRVNVFPEGYYYKPHYRVMLREYSEDVQEGYHTKVYIKGVPFIEGRTVRVSTVYGPMDKDGEVGADKEYFFQNGERVLLVYEDYSKIYGTVVKVEGGKHNEITLEGDGEISPDFTLFKINPLKPEGAYEIGDLSGRYVWKELKGCDELNNGSEIYDAVFTNGATYFHKNINFYLKRQDPTGDYFLSYQNRNNGLYILSDFTINGNEKEIDEKEYKKDGKKKLC